jgi:hypothetical protein
LVNRAKLRFKAIVRAAGVKIGKFAMKMYFIHFFNRFKQDKSTVIVAIFEGKYGTFLWQFTLDKLRSPYGSA